MGFLEIFLSMQKLVGKRFSYDDKTMNGFAIDRTFFGAVYFPSKSKAC